MASYELKNLAEPDDVREFPFGRGEIVDIGGGKVMRMTLQPGWRWSEHVKPAAGTELCQAPHFQYLVTGRLGVRTRGRRGVRGRARGRELAACRARRLGGRR
jgi:hypothetical protein